MCGLLAGSARPQASPVPFLEVCDRAIRASALRTNLMNLYRAF